MTSLSEIPVWVYKILLILATMIWGFSFVVMKEAVSVLPAAWLLGLRFLSAGVILFVILYKRVKAHFSKRALAAGAALAVFDFSAFIAQTIGLIYTTPGINAFLTATYCVIVPFAWWVVARKRPSLCNVGAACIAVVGIWLVSVNAAAEAFSIGLGEALTLLSAVLFAVHIVFVSRFTKTHDALTLTVFQFLFAGCAVPEPGIGIRRGVLRAAVRRGNDGAPFRGLCVDLRGYPCERGAGSKARSETCYSFTR